MLETAAEDKRRGAPGLTISDAAAAVGVSRYVLRKAIDRQQVRVIEFGGMIRIPQTEIRRLIKLFEGG